MTSIPCSARGLSRLRLLALATVLGVTLSGCQSLSSLDSPAISAESSYSLNSQTALTKNARNLSGDPFAMAETEIVIEQEDTQIWPRIRQGYQLVALGRDNPRVQDELNRFSQRTTSLEIIAGRSNPYLHHIVEQLEKHNMPLELALLPIIESGFDPLALSSQSASGLWQFMPATGRSFNLKQTHWYDGRRDVIQSTNAAIQYLTYLNKMFDGDWLLSLAAYNAGEGTVMRAIRNNRAKGLPTDYWNLKLPPQTLTYIPKLLAVAQIFAEPEQHGLKLPPIANEPFFTKVSLKHELDLHTVASLADVSPEKLIRLNPAFNQKITLGGPGYLLVPTQHAEDIHQGLSQLKPSQLFQWPTYKVQANDNLSTIARRHGTNLAMLRELNQLPNDRLRIGQVLKVPPKSLMASHAQSRPARYRVKSGDNLSSIAARYNLSVAELKRWNNLSSSSIRAGQTLNLKQTATLYTVRSGDSLYSIASRHKVTVKQIKSWNTLNSNLLRPGQQLALYP